MYRCKECQAEYKEKVEYCDCGNNTFDYIEDAPVLHKSEKKHFKTDDLKTKGDIVSIAFFVICIILSILIWAFAGNSTAKEQKTSQVKTVKQQTANKNIPNIDKIWDNTPLYQPKPTEQQPEVTETNKNPVTPTSADYLQPVNTPKTSTTSTPKTKPVTKNIQSPVPKNTVTKPVQPKVTQNKPVQKTIPAYNPNDPELLQYKSALRAALFSKFAVGSIQGSGTCIIKFTLNKDTGKLENRAFLKKSDNKALNDAVYYMLMSVPRFKTPPSSYNGEEIRMKFYLNNGYYEISFI